MAQRIAAVLCSTFAFLAVSVTSGINTAHSKSEQQEMIESLRSENKHLGKEAWAKFPAGIMSIDAGGLFRLRQEGSAVVGAGGLRKGTIPDMLCLVSAVRGRECDDSALEIVEKALVAAKKKGRPIAVQVFGRQIMGDPKVTPTTRSNAAGMLNRSSSSITSRPQLVGFWLGVKPELRLALNDGTQVDALPLTKLEETFILADRSDARKRLTMAQYCMVFRAVRMKSEPDADDLQEKAEDLRRALPPDDVLELDFRVVDLTGKVLCTASAQARGRELRQCLAKCVRDLLEKTELKGSLAVMTPTESSVGGGERKYGPIACQMLTTAMKDYSDLTLTERSQLVSVLKEHALNESDVVKNPAKLSGILAADLILLGSIASLGN